MRQPLFLIVFCLFFNIIKADGGYKLWLKYNRIEDSSCLDYYRKLLTSFHVAGDSKTINAAKEELQKGLSGLLGTDFPEHKSAKPSSGKILAGTPASVPAFKKEVYRDRLSNLRKGGYLIRTEKNDKGNRYSIAANDDIGVLYGIFHFLRLLQTRASLENLHIQSAPKLDWRMLDHWDNLDGSVTRGYAGKSLWKWDELPQKINSRYKDYARANASIGINAVVLNNVNADPKILTGKYINKAAALAEVFHPYGIKVFLSINFASPKALGELDTADPLNQKVKKWWQEKANEIYKKIPDFGGFLVKANSEKQPGPQDYNRTHVDGANMLANALEPHQGILIWRAFVYSMKKGGDRAKMAYDEFIDFDGKFNANVFLQIKNGPLDFQPREPFSPLFGAMPHTHEMMEFQITQEYLGHDKALVYLAPLYKETLEADTFINGKGSTVGRIIDGSLQDQKMTGMAGVTNIGDDNNWTGYLFGQANWYAFGRLAWDYNLSAEDIAKEWINMTLTHDIQAIKIISDMMLDSRETFVSYQTPLGLNVLADFKHYDPDPTVRGYYHKADSSGLGFDRTSTGSNAVAQYAPPLRDSLENIETTPEQYMAWFHHIPWNYKMKSGRNFWEELSYKYDKGVKGVIKMEKEWESVKEQIDPEIYNQTKKLLNQQIREAKKWKKVNLNYFKEFSGKPIPKKYRTFN